MNAPLWKSLPAKLQLYEALYSLNRGFEATLLGLERLEHLGMFRLENLNAFKVSLEHTRAQANEELIQSLQEYEEGESARFDRMEREWEKQLEDPDDVFFPPAIASRRSKSRSRPCSKAWHGRRSSADLQEKNVAR